MHRLHLLAGVSELYTCRAVYSFLPAASINMAPIVYTGHFKPFLPLREHAINLKKTPTQAEDLDAVTKGVSHHRLGNNGASFLCRWH